MKRTIGVAALTLLAMSLWAQPSFAQGGHGAWRAFAPAGQLDVVPADIRWSLDRVENQVGDVQLVTFKKSGPVHKIVHKWKNWHKKKNHHNAPLPLAGGLPALALMGAALALARAARRRNTDPQIGGDVVSA